MLHSFDTRPEAPPRLPDGFDVPFTEAIAWAEQRKAVLPAEFYGARLQAVRARSFTVSSLAALDQVQQVADSLAEATASGQTLRDWRKTLPPDVLSLGKARTELIFRNAVQTHYGIGRTIQQRENAAARGFLMWDAINDSRTRPAHAAMDGHIAAIDAPIWKKWNAPAGHNCRCTRIALTEAQARARGYPKLAPAVEPDKGWEGDPTEGNEDLVGIVKARRDACSFSFAAKRRGRGLWCEDGEAKRRIELLQSAVDNAPMTDELMRRSLGAALFNEALVFVSSRSLPAEVAAARLTLAEKVALHVWTLDTSPTPWFARINAMMRMVELPPGELEAVLPVAHALLSGLRKLPPFVGTVYRGIKERPMGADGFASFLEAHEVGEQAYHLGFSATTVDANVQLRGRAKLILESVCGRDISSLSVKQQQREVLFMPPLRMRVTRKEVFQNGVVTIWASEILK